MLSCVIELDLVVWQTLKKFKISITDIVFSKPQNTHSHTLQEKPISNGSLFYSLAVLLFNGV